MPRRIALNAVDMATPTHQSPGLWRRPDHDHPAAAYRGAYVGRPSVADQLAADATALTEESA